MSSRGTARVAEADDDAQRSPEPGESPAAGGPVGAWRLRIAVLRHYRIVYRVAYALLHDQHEAEDATQEAYLRYWQQGGGVRREREWLLAVVRNASLDRLRHGRRTVTTAEPPETAEDERDPAWHAQHDESAARLRAAIAALPEPQRSLVVLFDMQGLDGAACGRVLGLSTNQVKVYLHRARRKLRRMLDEEAP